MASLLSVMLPPHSRIRLRATATGYRTTVSTRSGDHEDASAHLASSDHAGLDEAVRAVYGTILDSFQRGVVPRDQRFTAATQAFHAGQPGVRPRSEASRLRLQACADDLVVFCHGHARAILDIRRFASARSLVLSDVPDHQLLAHALDDMSAADHRSDAVSG